MVRKEEGCAGPEHAPPRRPPAAARVLISLSLLRARALTEGQGSQCQVMWGQEKGSLAWGGVGAESGPNDVFTRRESSQLR